MFGKNKKFKSVIFIVLLSTCFNINADTQLNNSSDRPNQQAEDKSSFEQLTSQQIAEQLGWISNPQLNCKGYYQEPASLYWDQQNTPFNLSPLKINADSSELSQVDTSIFAGNVTVSQPHRQLSADKIYLYRNQTTQELEYADLQGNVYYREPGRLIVSEKARLNIQDESGTLYHVLYRAISLNINEPEKVVNKEMTQNEQVNIYQLTAWGKADKIVRDKVGVIDIEQGTYTTCPPGNEVWDLKAKHLNLNKETGRGTANHVWLTVKDIPVAYSPYLSFPIDNRRQSGFLLPLVGSSTDSGFTFATPYYFNLAPNYDATLTPAYLEKRGVQLNGEFRYLTETGLGNLHASFLPNDRAFNSFRDHLLEKTASEPDLPGRNRLVNTNNDRYLFSFNDEHRYNPNWSSYLYINKVSDDYYFQDFNNDPMETTENQIYNDAEVRYADEHWNFVSRLEGYQTLHPFDQAPVNNQYKKLPELILNGNYANVLEYFDLQLTSSAVNFAKNKNPGAPYVPVEGKRFNINPALSVPFYWIWGYANPQLQMAATQYDLSHQNARLEYLMSMGGNSTQIAQLQNEFTASNVNRVLPIASYDMGLYFDRYLNLGNHSYQQTLEPRLFYLYVPYRNQDDIPLFDTALQPFTFDQLFVTNRFNGIDRIGDANQVSLALTTRLLDQQTGIEKFRASIGQIQYFSNRQVLAPAQQLDIANVTTLTNPSPTAPTSPVVAEAMYNAGNDWRVISNMSWDPNIDRVDSGNVILQYRPDNQHIVNLSYVFLRGGDALQFINPNSQKNNLYQTDISVLWPLINRWSGVARWNYNISHRFTQNALAGLQYDSCCWAVRFLGGRQFKFQEINSINRTTRPILDNQFYIELAFKGLGNLSNKSPSGLLTESILGYEDTFGLEG